jgi:hypothetical protein
MYYHLTIISNWKMLHRADSEFIDKERMKKNILINKFIFKIYFLYHWNSGIVILLSYIWLNNEHYPLELMRYIYRKINAIFYKDRTNIIIQASFKINKTLNTLTLTNISFWMIFRDGKNSSHSLTLVTFVVLSFVHMIYEKKNSYVFSTWEREEEIVLDLKAFTYQWLIASHLWYTASHFLSLMRLFIWPRVLLLSADTIGIKFQHRFLFVTYWEGH